MVFPPELLQFNKERQKISAAELLFGFTELNETDTDNTLAYAGKVRISAGMPLGNPDDDELLDPETVPLKVLSSPKLPSPALYFTSGTTGNPKGVTLTHNNILSNVLALYHIFPVDDTNKSLSYLPVSHVYERTNLYIYQYLGVSIYYAENMGTIADNMKEISPEMLTTVPRLLEKV